MADSNNPFVKDSSFVELFNLRTPEKVIETALNESAKTFHSKILSTSDSFKKGKDLKEELSNNYNIFSEKDKSYVIMQKDQSGNPNFDDKTTAYFDKSFRNVTYVDAFFNTLPNVVLGRLTPLLKIKFLFPKKDFENNEKFTKQYLNKVPSLQNYISDDLDDNELYDFNKNFVINFENKDQVKDLGFDEYTRRSLPFSGSYFITDESLYTAPPQLSKNFRPLMSISKMQVKVVPTIDFNVSFDEYNLSLVIHDKTQLHKFSQLIGVEYRSDITAIIEYGWSYSDGEDINSDPYSYLFNKILRKKVYCGLVNASYSFDDLGQVKMEMKLMTKGADKMVVLDCLESTTYSASKDVLKKLQDKFKQSLEKYQVTSIRDGVLLQNITNESIESLTKEQANKIDSLIRTLSEVKDKNTGELLFDKGSNDYKDFVKQITDIKKQLIVDSKTGVSKQKQAYKDFISTQIIEGFKKWVKEYRQKNKISLSNFENVEDKNKKVFLHEILTYFISVPLLKNENSLEEIQMIFYNFNGSSPEKVKSKSIGEFEIDVEHLKQALSSNENKKYTLEQFIGFILNEFLRKLTSPGFGMGGTYQNLYNASSQTRKSAEEKNKKNVEKYLKEHTDAGFQIIEPKVSFRVENQNNIIRIHVYDGNNRIIFTANKKLIDTVDSYKQEFENWKKEKTKSIQNEIGQIRSAEISKIRSEFSNQNFSYLKEIFKNSYPVLTFDGVGSNVIKSFQISNNMDAATTTHLINKSMDNVKSDTFLQNTYTRVVPGKITMESLGFPIAEVHQTFFIDMNTGTDIDNLYHVTSVSHNIEPGSFKTSYELANADNYGAHINLYNELNRIEKVMTGKIKEAKQDVASKNVKGGISLSKIEKQDPVKVITDFKKQQGLSLEQVYEKLPQNKNKEEIARIYNSIK